LSGISLKNERIAVRNGPYTRKKSTRRRIAAGRVEWGEGGWGGRGVEMSDHHRETYWNEAGKVTREVRVDLELWAYRV